jgi:clathrin heavy chain
VWSSLARAQLDSGKVQDAIDSYVKANDPSEYSRVIDAAHTSQQHHALINFLQMARKKDFGTQVRPIVTCAS